MPALEEKQETILKDWTETWNAFNMFEGKLRSLRIILLEDKKTKDLHLTHLICSEIDNLLNEMPPVITKRYDAALAHFNKLLERV